MKLKFTEPKRSLRRTRHIITSRTSVAKANEDNVLNKLNEFLNKHIPTLALLIHSLFKDQQKVITFTELKEAVTDGYIKSEMINEMQDDYIRFVERSLEPKWTDAIKQSAEEQIKRHMNNFVFDPMQETIRNWIRENGARWVTNETQTVQNTLRTMIDSAVSGKYSADELARNIRPTIGLTEKQAAANLRYYTNMKKKLTENHPKMKPQTIEKRAAEAAEKYANRQLKYRAETIAQTELTFAYARGAEETIKQAQEQGFMGKVMRRWVAAPDDGKRCDLCAELDGKLIDMDESYSIPGAELFEGMHRTPPAHPRCRCAVQYVEVKPQKNITEFK